MGLFSHSRPHDQPSGLALLQLADALILFDAPLLDSRFMEVISRHPDAETRAHLSALPPKVGEGSRHTRRAAMEWEAATGGGLIDDAFRDRATRVLLQGLLESAEAQIRLKVFMANHAPNRETREHLDRALAIHYELVSEFRSALDKLGPDPGEQGRESAYLGTEGAEGELRTRVERAIHQMRNAGHEPRALVLSHTGLRHLRDQGALPPGASELLGVPVEVDLAWDAPKFALLSDSCVPLEEVMREAR